MLAVLSSTDSHGDEARGCEKVGDHWGAAQDGLGGVQKGLKAYREAMMQR